MDVTDWRGLALRMEPRRILVTGATGFIGRHVVDALLAAGLAATVAVRRIDACPSGWRSAPSIRCVETGPLETATNLAEASVDAETVVHLAGLAHVRHSKDDEPFLAANARATQKLAEAAAGCDVHRFIHMSSLFAITDNASSDIVDDNTNRPPSTAYGRSKRLAEAAVEAFAAKGRFAVSLRPTLVIGADAGGNWRSLQKLAATGLPLPFASVHNRRSLVSVESVVSAVVHLCTGEWPADKSGNYCLADRGALSLAQIVARLRAGMGLPTRLLPFPPPVLAGLLGMAGRRRQANGMMGNLEVDASRFASTFGFGGFAEAAASVEISGKRYRDQMAKGRWDSAP